MPSIPKRERQPLATAEKYDSLLIPVLKNETLDYGLEEQLTASLIEYFMNDGRIRIARRSNADLILEGVITEVLKNPLAYDNRDRVVGYELTIHVRMRLVEPYDPNDPDDEPVVVAGPREFVVHGPSLLSHEIPRGRARDFSTMLAEQVFSQFFEDW